MQGALIPIKPPAGYYANGTRYEASGRWTDGNLVRFLDGTIRPVGGWAELGAADGGALGALTGVPRGATAWRADDGSTRIVIGTHTTLYVIVAGAKHDVTPAGYVAGHVDTLASAGSSVVPTAYGAGNYGAGPYGTALAVLDLADATTWQLDTFGSYVVGVSTSDGRLFVWAGDPAVAAAPPAGAPTLQYGVVVTPERFVVSLGATSTDPAAPGPNVRLVRWASQETTDDWTPSDTNTAGEFELATRGRLLAGRRARRQTLLWTDADVHTMTYIGGEFLYSFEQAGDNCGLLAPNAVAMVDTQAYWMGRDGFFHFDGFVKSLPCDVRDRVFGDFNVSQAAKVCAVPKSQYGEVWWYYPSAGSTENDCYVCFNYREGHWTTGRLARTAGFDAGATARPMLCSPAGRVYEHELNDTRRDVGGPVLRPFLESGPMELDAGDRVGHVLRIVPDEKTLGDVQATFFTALYPTDDETVVGPFPLHAPTDVRFVARQVRIRFDEVQATSWRVGTTRLAVKIGGRR